MESLLFFEQLWEDGVFVVANGCPGLDLEVEDVAHVVVEPLHYVARDVAHHLHLIRQPGCEIVLIVNVVEFAATGRESRFRGGN